MEHAAIDDLTEKKYHFELENVLEVSRTCCRLSLTQIRDNNWIVLGKLLVM